MRRAVSLILVLLMFLITGCTTNIEENKVPNVEESILANKTVWSTTENICEVPVEAIEKIQGSELYRFQDSLLSVYYVYDREVKKSFYYLDKISLESGAVVATIKLEDMRVPEIQVLEEHIVVKNIEKKSAYIYDSSLEFVEERVFDSNFFVFSNDLSKVYVFNDQAIQEIKGDTTTTLLDIAGDVSISEVTDEYVSFTYVDMDTLLRVGAILDLDSSIIQTIPFTKSLRTLEYSDGIWLADLYNEECEYSIGNNEFKCIELNEHTSVSLLEESGHVLLKGYNDEYQSVLDLYDVEGGYISSIELVDTLNPLMYEPVWFEEYNGYFLTLMSKEDGMDRLLFWDLSKTSNGEDMILSDLEESIVESKVSSDLFEKADELSSKYGVNILIAEQCDTELPEHTASLLVSEEDIQVALDTLDVTLAMYPDNFFRQLKHDTFDTIEIQVLGTLVKNTSTEDVTYISGGLVFAENDRLVMALDSRGTFEKINKNLQQTIFHESSHMIERRLMFRSKYVEDAVYSEERWNSLNPDGFKYNDSYYGTLDPRYSNYFIDQYACSNAMEDRARILEYAAMGKLEQYSDMNGIMDKYEYYCEAIRDGFDSSEWEERVVWE